VWQTILSNPDFARYAEICGALRIEVTEAGQLPDALTPPTMIARHWSRSSAIPISSQSSRATQG
jgi:hypothetical protein